MGADLRHEPNFDTWMTAGQLYLFPFQQYDIFGSIYYLQFAEFREQHCPDTGLKGVFALFSAFVVMREMMDILRPLDRL